jgi:5-methylcytosine-specific restriction endonuclease McrA
MTMKVCHKCKEIKPWNMFNKARASTDGLYSMCKRCSIACYKDKKEGKGFFVEAGNKTKLKTRKAWKKQVDKDNKKDYEKIIKSWAEARESYLTAKEIFLKAEKVYLEVNKEKLANNYKDWREANSEKKAEVNSRYRAKKLNAIPEFLLNCELEKQRIRYIYEQRNFLNKVTGVEHHVDHIWPLSKGGPHWSGNLQILTATENLSKSDKVCKTLKKNIKASLEIARKEYDEDHSNGHRD